MNLKKFTKATKKINRAVHKVGDVKRKVDTVGAVKDKVAQKGSDVKKVFENELEPLNQSAVPQIMIGTKDMIRFMSQHPNNAISWLDTASDIARLGTWFFENGILNKSKYQVEIDSIDSPSKYNATWKRIIWAGWQLIKNNQTRILELGLTFATVILFRRLSESENDGAGGDLSAQEDLFLNKSIQFVFDCGVIMETVESGKIDGPISLKYHLLNSVDSHNFIQSIKDFLATTDQQITKFDVLRLENIWNKHTNDTNDKND